MHPVEATVLARLRLTAKMRILEGGGGGQAERTLFIATGRLIAMDRKRGSDLRHPHPQPLLESFSHTWANYPESRSRWVARTSPAQRLRSGSLLSLLEDLY